MNNGILYSSQPSILDSRTLATLPLNGNILNSCVTPYHYPLTNNQYEGYKNGNDYVIVIDTTVNNSLTITMRLWLAIGALFTIDWGDGSSGATIPAGTTNIRSGSFETLFLTTGGSIPDISHTYSRHGQYIVKFMGIATTNTTSTRLGLGFLCSNITHVLSFGKNNNLTICLQINNTNLIYVPDFAPPQHLGNYGDNGGMFNGCNKLNDSKITKWNMDNATSLLGMFQNCWLFNQNIENWNTSNVTSMANTFYAAYSFNQSLNGWNTSNVTSMANMFSFGSAFNQSLDNWNVRKVTNFSSMFNAATSFNGSLSGWAPGADTSGTNCTSMFQGATKFVGSGLDSWDTSKVTNMNSMFNGAVSLGSGISLNLNSWNISGVTTFDSMFMNTSSNPSYINNINIDNWSFGSANLSYMFRNSQWKRNLSGWDVSKVTSMQGMFYGNYSTVTGSGLETWNLAGLNSNTSLDLFATTCSFSSGQYDLILNNWNNNKASGVNGVANWRTDLRPDFGTNKYTSAASVARASLVSYGWTITDGGAA